jgi:hypothetical protein
MRLMLVRYSFSSHGFFERGAIQKRPAEGDLIRVFQLIANRNATR